MEPKRRDLRNDQEREGDGDGLDRLSSLPDGVLIYILSYLDTKTCVRTSVVSKRYKLLWTLLPSLDFKLPETRTSSLEFYDGYAIPQPQANNASIVSFQSYVNHVLKRREARSLTSFRLLLHKEVDLDFFQNCIDYVAEHKVHHLKIRGHVKEKPVMLPKLLFTSSSLVTMHLHNATSYCMELQNSATLPNLKVLCLKNFVFSDENFKGELFSGCPNLETLVLSKCCIMPENKLKILDVNCSNLKSLEIRNWRSPWKYFYEHMINVHAPKLDFFKFQGHLARVNFKDGLPSLGEAFIDLCCPTACTVVDATERMRRTSEVFLNMLRDIRLVKSLSLSLNTIEVLSALPDLRVRASSIFENLKFIKFTIEKKCKEKIIPIKTVMRLLERAATDILVVDGSKEPKLSRDCPKVKRKHKDATHIALPGNVMHFLLESSPSAESLSIEMPKEE